MLPSRGLRPAQFTYPASRQSMIVRCSAARKFSTIPRTAGLSAPSCRTNPLQSARWRTGASGYSNVVLTASSVRNGSWYAPWSWGKSSTPSGDATAAVDQVPVAQISNHASSDNVASSVTSATPDFVSESTEKAAALNTTSGSAASTTDNYTSFADAKTLDDLLGLEPAKDVLPKAEIDPTALVDHAGQLQELGLQYGWGMTTLFEKTIEQIYLQSGWGWAGSIMLAAVVVRGATFFFQALSSDKMAALAAMKPVTQPIQEKMEAAIARGDQQQAQIYKMQQAQIMQPVMGGVFSMGGFMIVQGWIGFCAFRFLRAMGELPVPGMSVDGFLWFTDLTVRDPYFILPAATTAIFYTVFKTGGETGVSNDVGSTAGQRQKLMTGMAFFLGIVTAFQASALQLYFLVSGVLGGCTAYLLRQNGFRRFIRIRPLPSKESTELYTRVAKGELKLKDIKGPDGKVRYQAPSVPKAPTNRRNATTLADINIRPGTVIPLHLRPEAPKVDTTRNDRDVDFDEGAKGTILEKVNWYRRNYKPSFVYRRLTGSMETMARNSGYGGGKKLTEQQEKRKKRAEQYEIERRRRFENRS